MKRFTLTELLVVVAVIGILVSMGLPSFYNARERAYQASCASGLSNIGKSITKQYALNNGALPSYNWMEGELMERMYICPKDDTPKSLQFFLQEEQVWKEGKTSFGFNLTSIVAEALQEIRTQRI